jgi:hypothetical protein
VNRVGRHPRTRADLTRTFAALTAPRDAGHPVVGPIFLPDRRGLDDLHRDGARLAGVLTGPLVGAVRAVLDRGPADPRSATGSPLAIAPGSLGSWLDEEAAG